MKHLNYSKGRLGENLAKNYLIKKGFKPLDQNYRTPHGEIDLIMLDGPTLVFIEVKLKIGTDFGLPEDMISKTKLFKFKKQLEDTCSTTPLDSPAFASMPFASFSIQTNLLKELPTMKTYPINIIENTNPLFPQTLLDIKPQIKKLYYRGTLNPKLFRNTLAVVGSRRSTTYGKQVIKKFIPLLIQQNITIVSGFMYGIDTLAHQETLDCGGQTIAVLGSGLNYLYPTENEKIYQQIIESGGIILSEYEPDFKPTRWSFPQRNRIVSGLSTLGVLIVEASLKSGSLVTAALAQKQHKPLFAIPGPITSSSSTGTNNLIKLDHAKAVTSPEDITIIQNTTSYSKQTSLIPKANLTPVQSQILLLLSAESLSLDELSLKLNLPIPDLTTHITHMTLNNLIEDINGKIYLASP